VCRVLVFSRATNAATQRQIYHPLNSRLGENSHTALYFSPPFLRLWISFCYLASLSRTTLKRFFSSTHWLRSLFGCLVCAKLYSLSSSRFLYLCSVRGLHVDALAWLVRTGASHVSEIKAQRCLAVALHATLVVNL